MAQVSPDSEETLLLLDRIQAGDRKAFEELFTQHQATLQQLIEFRLDPRLRGRLDACDVVQETQLEAFRRLPDFLRKRPMPFRLWLRKTALERLRMLERQHLEAHKRTAGREQALPDGSSVAQPQLAGPDPTPSQQVAKNELAQHVRDALAQLEELDREILLMRAYEGLSHEETACILDIAPAAARKRYGRALLRLHKILTELGLTESQL